MKAIQVFIVDDHPLMRNSLEMAIEATFDMEIAGEAANGVAALRLIPLLKPDVVLMDLLMPEMSGLEAIHALVTAQPAIRILVLSSLDRETDILGALQSGAMGYVTKDAQRDELLQAIRRVHAGEVFMSPKVAAKIMRTFKKPHPQTQKPAGTAEPLTCRQIDVLELLGQGCSNQQIADRLHIAPGTVRVHISHMLANLGLDHRHELVVYAVKKQLAA
jgi:DNA-binding NarL/FixJ family response regulator